MGGSLQRRWSGCAESRDLARVPQRGQSPKAERRKSAARRLHRAARSNRDTAAARCRQHADRWGDPMQYLQKYPNRFWSFHLKDVVADRSSDTRLGTGIFDFKRFLAAVPNIEQKPGYVEDESPADELGAARSNYQYLRGLEF